MIATITPLPWEAHTLRLTARVWRWAAAYGVGLVAGTTTVGLMAGTVGTVVRGIVLGRAGLTPLWIVVVAVIAVAYGLREVNVLRLPVPEMAWQVPAIWIRYGRTAQAFLFGIALGVEFLTFMPYATFYVLLLFEATLGVKGGVLLGGVYGVARLIPTVGGIVVSYCRRRSTKYMTDWIMSVRTRDVFHRVNGLALLVVGEVLIGLLLVGLPLGDSTGSAASPRLGPIPSACPVGSAPTTLGQAEGPGPTIVGYGAFPVWGLAFEGGQATLRWGTNPQMLRLQWQPPYGWQHRMLWLVKPSFRGRIELRGGSLRGGQPLWFALDGPDQAVTQALMLDPQRMLINHGPKGAWPQFPGDVYVPQAGCYYLDARWPGGRHWRISFAAGQAR